MKAKVSRGGGFRGALNYVFDVGKDATHTKNAERVGGNMAGNDPRELSREFSAVRQLRPDIGKPVWHCSLSLPPGERLSAEKWEAVAADFMQRMGFDQTNTPWVAVRHQDTDKDHIHIVASRVGLDGKVWLGQWEARRAIEATQELERVHGLTLTPGLGDARAERRKLTDKEINMAVRTGDEPPRQRLQRLLDEAVKDKPTAPELAERLQAAGVIVRANVASTGRMNGFSFEVAGVAFKGSDLGKGYTWAGLQKAGVTYDEARDRAGLERFRPATADRGERANAAAGREPDAERATSLARRDSSDRGPAASLDREHGPAAGRCLGSAAPGAGRADSRDGIERGSGDAAASAGLGKAATADAGSGAGAGAERASDRGDAAPDRGLARPYIGGGGRDAQRSSGATERSPGREAEMVADAGRSSGGRGAGRAASGDWASRFRAAVAARRRAAAGAGLGSAHAARDASRARVDQADRQSARELDPTAYLEASGYTVKREGRHLSVRAGGDEVYRVTRQHDGRWLWCDRYGNYGGDTIDLVREIEPGTGYAEAVYRLLGGPRVAALPPSPPPARVPPVLPREQPGDRKLGREYLRGRGISDETIREAERQGMLAYTSGGVLFVGRDKKGVPQNVTRRAIDADDPVQKRDLRGSDKSHPPMLRGTSGEVWAVEGGADALALWDLMHRARRALPTVIVTGGAHVVSWVQRLPDLLRGAARVVIAHDREADPERQARADAGHARQREELERIGARVTDWRPPEQVKDLAELNAQQVAEIERQRQAEIEARERPSVGVIDRPTG